MISLDAWYELEEEEQREKLEHIKSLHSKQGLVIVLDWLSFMEETQNFLKNDQEEKRKFWDANTELQIERPLWLSNLEKYMLFPGFIDDFQEILQQEPNEETLLIYIFKNMKKLEDLPDSEEKNYSNKIDFSQLLNYSKKMLPKNFGVEKIFKLKDEILEKSEIEPIDILEFSNDDIFQEENFLYASRMISGCLRNFIIIQQVNIEKKLLAQQKFPEKEEILKFITITIGIINLLFFFNFELKNQQEVIKNQENFYSNKKLNEVLLDQSKKEIEKLIEKINNYKVKLDEHLKNFYKIYKWFNDLVKKTMEKNGMNIESLLKNVFENLIKSKKLKKKKDVLNWYIKNFDDLMVSKGTISLMKQMENQRNEEEILSEGITKMNFNFEDNIEKYMKEITNEENAN
eukprot:gene2558-3520_t